MKPPLTSFLPLLHRLSPLLAGVFLLLWLRSCREGMRQEERFERNLSATESLISSTRLANGQLAQEKGLLELNVKALREQLSNRDDSLKLLLKRVKHPVAVVKWHTQYVRDTLFLPFDAPVEQEFQRDFSLSENWFSLSGSMDQWGVRIDRLSIPNTQRLVVGYRKGRPVVSVTNSNPYLVTEGLDGAVVPLRRKSWVFGIGGTWDLQDPPTAGFFFGYKIFEF